MANPNFRVPGNPEPWPPGEVAAYHITHLENIEAMVAAGAIKCDKLCNEEAIERQSIAHKHIKSRRDNHPVTVAQGGTLADYVPFYYAPCSPMLFTINKGNVEGYTDGQRAIAHLVIAAVDVAKEGTFVITDGHAAMPLSRQFDTSAGFREIAWQIMRDKYWSDNDEDGDRTRKRQAELLVHRQVPFEAVRLIGVYDEEAHQAVVDALAGTAYEPSVRIREDWYY